MAALRAKPISALPSTTSAAWDDSIPVAQLQGGNEVTVQETVLQIRKFAGAASVVSGSTVDIDAVQSAYVTITGTDAISSFGTAANISKTILIQDGLTLVNSSALICPQATNLTLSANDVIQVISDSSANFRVSAYFPYNGFVVMGNDFIGDSGSGGVKGLVPAPFAGSAAAGCFLSANGNWESVAAPLVYPISTQTGNYTVLNTDFTVLADAASNDIVLTLPGVTPSSGKILCIKRIDSSANAVSITGDANIDGSSSYYLSFQYQSVFLQSSGTEWLILSS